MLLQTFRSPPRRQNTVIWASRRITGELLLQRDDNILLCRHAANACHERYVARAEACRECEIDLIESRSRKSRKRTRIEKHRRKWLFELTLGRLAGSCC